ncbi:unnamed protein product [Hermetia illucens]|uniref:Uncharacterized protein n=2 Tax=Hermetia illucens TaxID=343691 RepID=A0A7R8Z0N9_HERIL|nr:unnamed protein product [Hermetia illucens]
MMNGKGFNLLHRLSYLVMSKISNCNHTCPFKGWFEVKDAIVETKWIPSVLPDGLYRFDTQGVNEEGYVGAMKFYVIVTNPDF